MAENQMKVFTDESLATFVEEIKLYTDTAVSIKSDADHVHEVATQSTSGFLSAENKTQLDYGGIPIVETKRDPSVQSGTGYIATVDGITELKPGLVITIIPYVQSTTGSPTLNVNNLGKKPIVLQHSYNLITSKIPSNSSWLPAGYPITIQYTGSKWSVFNVSSAYGPDIYGTVKISNGGTGATTADDARTNLDVYSKTEVDDAISGKADTEHSHSISEVTDLQVSLDTKVPISTKVNGKELSSDITLSASDVGADASGSANTVQVNLDTHISDTSLHFTTAEKTKLSGVESGAQKNTITGIKGNSESTYRTGNVNITKSNIGLGNVDNTSDINKPVSTAQQTAIDTSLENAKSYTDTALENAKSYTDTSVENAKSYTDTAVENVKNELLNGAGEAYDTLKELGDLIDENVTAIDALESVATNKMNKENPTGTGNLSIDGNAWISGTIKVGGINYDNAFEIALKTDIDTAVAQKSQVQIITWEADD